MTASLQLLGRRAIGAITYPGRGRGSVRSMVEDRVEPTQFSRTPDGWRMSSMAWDDERLGLELPARYAT